MKFTRMIAVSAAAAMLLSGCMGLYETEDENIDTFTTIEEMETYLSTSEDVNLSALTEYLVPTHVPEGMTLTNCEVQPDRHFVTYYYNLNRYVPTTDEIAEELVKDIDVSAFSFFPTTGMRETAYDPEKAERLAQKAAREGWSVRQLEEAVRLDALPRKKVTHRMDPEVKRAASALRSRLRAKVAIEGDQEKGKIIISYFSKDDLMNICDAILDNEE